MARSQRLLVLLLLAGSSFLLAPPARPAPDPLFRRGDSNADGALNLTDAISTLNHLFIAGPAVPCEDAADADDDGRLNLTDAVYSLNHLFIAGPPPPEPID